MAMSAEHRPPPAMVSETFLRGTKNPKQTENEILLRGFRKVALTPPSKKEQKQNRTDGLTDVISDGRDNIRWVGIIKKPRS